MMIEFQYFEGCPNFDTTLRNLKELISEGLISEKEVKITEVLDLVVAEQVCFQGSPTILVNGYDIYSGIIPKTANYSCRVYKFGNKRTGIIPKDYIKLKIDKLNSV
jgi:hypothetical protein